MPKSRRGRRSRSKRESGSSEGHSSRGNAENQTQNQKPVSNEQSAEEAPDPRSGVIDGVRYRSGARLCNAKGDTCGAFALNGKEKCYYHGGPTPTGIESARGVHMRYSKDLPERLLERAEEALLDDQLYDMREEAAVVQARVGDLLSRTESGESGHLWLALQDVWPKYLKSIAADDEEMIAEQRQYIDQLITSGANDYKAWEEAMAAIDFKRKIGDSARRREVDLGVVVNAAQVSALTMAMADIFRRNVRRYVTDPDQQYDVLLAASTEIDGILYIGDGAPSPS